MRTSRAFTLIELLVVLVIIGLLATLGLAGFRKFLAVGEDAKVQAQFAAIKLMLEQYKNSVGDYPASRLDAYDVRPPNKVNEGSECLVLAFHAKDYDGRGFDDKELANPDGDEAPKNATKFDRPVLLEVIDAWGNPVTYIRYDDYERSQEYEFVDQSTQDKDLVPVSAEKNPVTGSFYAKESYQLRSAGPDGVFGTDDDIRSYQ